MSMISLPTAKEFLQITHLKEDTVLQIMIDACEEWVAKQCGILLHASTIPSRSDYCDGGYKYLRTPYHPITALTKIYDRTDEADLESDDYCWDEWKAWYEDGAFFDAGDKRFYVTYKAGYTYATCPAGLKMIILNLIHRQYNKRGGVTMDSVLGASQNWEALLSSDEWNTLRGYSYNLGIS